MVQFTDPLSGQPFSVNPSDISSISPFWSGGTEIKMKNGTVFYAKEDYKTVVAELKKDGVKWP